MSNNTTPLPWPTRNCDRDREPQAWVNLPTSAKMIDWMESVHTLHRNVEILYVVDGYQVEITSDGARIAGPWWGVNLRYAVARAMRDWNLDTIPRGTWSGR